MKNSFTVHQNYVAADQERNPLFLSVVTSEVSDQSVPHYRVILWRKTVSIRPYLYHNYCNLSDTFLFEVNDDSMETNEKMKRKRKYR